MLEPKVLTFKLKLGIFKMFLLKFKILLGLKINLFEHKGLNLFRPKDYNLFIILIMGFQKLPFWLGVRIFLTLGPSN
jgi:hypothetical protein